MNKTYIKTSATVRQYWLVVSLTTAVNCGEIYIYIYKSFFLHTYAILCSYDVYNIGLLIILNYNIYYTHLKERNSLLFIKRIGHNLVLSSLWINRWVEVSSLLSSNESFLLSYCEIWWNTNHYDNKDNEILCINEKRNTNTCNSTKCSLSSTLSAKIVSLVVSLVVSWYLVYC